MSRAVRDLDWNENDIPIWPPPPMQEPEPYDGESSREELEAIYGKDYVQTLMRNDSNDKR